MKFHYKIGIITDFFISSRSHILIEFNECIYFKYKNNTSEWKKNYFDSEEEAQEILSNIQDLGSNVHDIVIQKFYTL